MKGFILFTTLLLLLGGCSYNKKICVGFTDWVEPARAEYFASSRVYPLDNKIRDLARTYQPQLILHPDGTPPIDFDDYLKDIDLVHVAGERKGETEKDVSKERLQQLDYAAMRQTYLLPEKEEVSSASPYPWYVQAFRSTAPHNDEEWLYIKYNIIFDWSGLAGKLSNNARAGINILRANPAKWHRLDVHTTVIIAVDPQGRQRFVNIAQHNYVRTYMAGRDFDPRKPIRVASAWRSNELYLDDGSTQAKEHRVVTFYNDIPYVIAGIKRPRYHGRDQVVGLNAGGIPLPTRLHFIEPNEPLAAYAGLLAPPKPLLGGIYIGRDGPMGYDYFAPPVAFDMSKLAALGYWQEGDEQLARQLASIIKEEKGNWQESEAMKKGIELMGGMMIDDLNKGMGLCSASSESIESIEVSEPLTQQKYCQ